MILKNSSNDQITQYLHSQGWINNNDKIIQKEVPGAGNMNFCLRINTKFNKSIILKQSSSYVEKYPQIPAPKERIFQEYSFYKSINNNKAILNMMPSLKGIDENSYIMAMSDLGECLDYTLLYNNLKISINDISDFINYLNELHSIKVSKALGSKLQNNNMRILNHEHIFIIPIEQNEIDLNSITSGLKEFSINFINNSDLIQKISELGKLYLSSGSTLIHGDFYPGSWIKSKNKNFVIDAEFSFLGPAEFDWGIFLAHMVLSNQENSTIDYLISSMIKNGLNKDLIVNFAGVEILRRLIGVAQLPLKTSLNSKVKMLDISKKMILTPAKYIKEHYLKML